MIINDSTPDILSKEDYELSVDDAYNLYNASNFEPFSAKRTIEAATSDYLLGVSKIPAQLYASASQGAIALGGNIKKFGESIKPEGDVIFDGNTLIEVGNKIQEIGLVNLKTANRNLEEMNKRAEKVTPTLTSEESDSWTYSITAGGLNYGTILGLSAITPNAGLGFVGAMTMGGETEEGLDTYKGKHGSLEGYENQAGTDLAMNTLNTTVQTILEKAFGAPAQLKFFRNVKEFARAGVGGFLEEFTTENLQNITDATFDALNGRLDGVVDENGNEVTFWSRITSQMKDTVVAGMFGGAAGIGFATYNRAKVKEAIAERIKDTVEPENLKKTVDGIYNAADVSMRTIVAKELENSSSLQAKRGDVYESMYKNTLQAVNNARMQGAYPELRTEADVAGYVKAESDRFADWVLAEANRRGTVIEEVLKGSDITYTNGKLSIGMTRGTIPDISKKIKQRQARETSLLQFLRSRGGVIDEGGELRNMDAGKQFIGLVNKNGMSLDAAGEALWQAGYFLERPTVNEVLEAIDDELRGNKKYPVGYFAEEAGGDVDIDYYIQDYADTLGYDLSTMSFDEKVQVYEQMNRNLNAENEFGDEIFFQESYDAQGKADINTPEFKAWFGDSKVVDEEGKPLIVYHGTDADFDVFDRTKTRANMDIQGNFFSPWEIDAQGYGENVRAFYLSIKNPASSSVGYAVLKKYQGQNNAGIKAREELERMGYDGVNNDNEEYIAFYPNQIKSVYNRGTWSPESDNIYEQRGSKSTRGSIQFTPDRALINLTESANSSTLAHELAHYYLQNTFLYNKSGLASPEYAGFYKSIANYLGIDDTQEQIETWQQEKWARAYEKYLLENKAPTPELKQALSEYNKWIKRAYRMLRSKPKYKNAEGKLVEPNLTPDIINTFAKLTGDFVARPDIEIMAETVTPELEKSFEEVESKVVNDIRAAEVATTYPTTQLRETADTGDTGRSAVALRVLGEELGYEVKNIEQEMQKARDFVKKNLNEARNIVNGKEAPKGLLSTAINIAYAEAMENSGNYAEAERATRIRSLEQTRRGQEIAMERATTDNILTSEYWSNMLIARKTQDVAKKLFNGDVKQLQDFINNEASALAKQLVGKTRGEKQKIIEDTISRVKEETGLLFQEDYENLLDAEYYNEILNETQLLIEDSLGMKADEEQVEFIHNNVRQLKDIVKETVSENGNLSIEAFKQIRKMYDTIDSYSPSSNLAVWSSIIGRGVMLFSIKSPILNVISNIENYATETTSRKALNIVNKQTNDDIVDFDIKEAYLKWDDEVYKASGFMPSVTDDIIGETPILGEKRISSQGEGKIRAMGRFVEDTIFKYGLGYFDNRFKARMFVDVIANKATQQAYNEKLSGDKARERANELFKDAILLKPMTEEGAEIRKSGMTAAHESTYTQDSDVAKVALKIRDVLNSGEFKAGDFLVPFVKTPANVVALGLEYSLGSVYTAYHVKDIIKNPQSDISQKAIKAAVRNGVGVLLSMILAGLIDDDDYIPEYDNASPKQRDIARLKNAPFNSVKIGNKWVSLDYFGPLAIPMAGILTARSKQNLISFFQGIGGQAAKTPGVKEITDLFGDVSRAIEYKVSFSDILEDITSWGVEQVASRTIPSIVTDIAKLADDYERETGGEMSRKIMAKIPFIRESLPIKTDITGRKIETEPTNILFGARVKTSVDNSVVREVDRLNKVGLAPTLSDPTRYGKFRELDTDKKDKIRYEFNKQYGREAKRLISSPSYKNMSDENKKKALNKIRRSVSDKLKSKYLKREK